MKRKGRRLSQEEERLWKRIADTTTPLEAQPTFVKTIGTPEKREPAPPPISPFRVGEFAASSKPETRITIPEQPLRMDRKAFTKMKRGKSQPEARLDLHGMTVDVAHSALSAFLLRSHSEGKRLVLVITGKGQLGRENRFGDTGRGILKRQVPYWLEQPPLRQIVLQTAPAHQKHGGLGAIYVYLRR